METCYLLSIYLNLEGLCISGLKSLRGDYVDLIILHIIIILKSV